MRRDRKRRELEVLRQVTVVRLPENPSDRPIEALANALIAIFLEQRQQSQGILTESSVTEDAP